MKHFSMSLAFVLASIFCGQVSAEQLTVVAKGRSCEDYFIGQMHIKGPVARAKAEEFAKANVEYKLKKGCDEKKGALTLGHVTTTCGAYEDQGMRGDFFTHSVCVSCEATATGDCI